MHFLLNLLGINTCLFVCLFISLVLISYWAVKSRWTRSWCRRQSWLITAQTEFGLTVDGSQAASFFFIMLKVATLAISLEQKPGIWATLCKIIESNRNLHSPHSLFLTDTLFLLTQFFILSPISLSQFLVVPLPLSLRLSNYISLSLCLTQTRLTSESYLVHVHRVHFNKPHCTVR